MNDKDERMRAAGIINKAGITDTVEIEYWNVFSKDTKRMVGVVTQSERGLWCEFTTQDSDKKYSIFGSEVSNREDGELVGPNGKIGYLTDYEVK